MAAAALLVAGSFAAADRWRRGRASPILITRASSPVARRSTPSIARHVTEQTLRGRRIGASACPMDTWPPRRHDATGHTPGIIRTINCSTWSKNGTAGDVAAGSRNGHARIQGHTRRRRHLGRVVIYREHLAAADFGRARAALPGIQGLAERRGHRCKAANFVDSMRAGDTLRPWGASVSPQSCSARPAGEATAALFPELARPDAAGIAAWDGVRGTAPTCAPEQ